MAQCEKILYGDFDTILNDFNDTILTASSSATFEGGSNYEDENVMLATRAYERYSAFGSNRVSLHITLLQSCGKVIFSAITAGGSSAMFFKINTLGESNFLDTIMPVVEKYSKKNKF